MDYEVELHEDLSPLTKSENRLVLPLVGGLTQKAIAALLHRSVKTVETHLGHIYQKLDVANDKQAITAFFVRGIVSVKKLVVCCLIVSGASNALMPSDAYARPSNDWSIPPVEEPFNRLRTRHGSGARTGSRLQLRRPSRRRED